VPPVVEEIAGTGKMIAFHCGADAYDRTHPARIAKIAGQYLEMQILCVHMAESITDGVKLLSIHK